MLRRLLALSVLFAALLPAAAHAETTKITFILTNDIYIMGETLMPDGKKRGGFARLAAVVKAERAKGGHVIFAHAGDTISPSLMSGIDRGAHILTLTNMIPPDIFVPGNHEFDFGKEVFFQRMAEAKFPLYGANLRGPNGQTLDNFKDRSIVTYDGVRIGLTGATFDGTPRMSSPDDLIFLPTFPTMKYQTEQLRREGADFVVTVVHADRKQDLALGAMRSIDLVLSGHDHDLFVNFDRSLIVESSYDAHYVVLMDITIEVKTTTDGRREVEWWPEIRIVDTATVTPDPEVAAVVAKFSQDLDRELNVPLATTSIELDSRNPIVRSQEAAIGSLIADAMRDATKADVAITNGGGIRGGRIYEAGSTITRRDVLGELPFGNRLVVLEMRGRDLRRALENGFAQLPTAAGNFPQISGLTVRVDASKPVGQRVVSVQVGNAPLLPAKTYKVATNDFLAGGGDNYTMFSSLTPTIPVDDAPLLANAVMSYLRKLGTIGAVTTGRIDIK